MLGDEAVSGAETPPPLPADKTGLEIKLQPADAIFGSVPLKDPEKASAPKETHFFRGLLRFGARAAAVACLCGLAWAGGAYYSYGYPPFHSLRSSPASAVHGPEHDELVGTVRQMAGEIRALKASVDSKDAAGESPKSQKASSTAGATITDLVARVDKLETDVTTKLSQVNEQLARIEKQVSEHQVRANRRAGRAGCFCQEPSMWGMGITNPYLDLTWAQ